MCYSPPWSWQANLALQLNTASKPSSKVTGRLKVSRNGMHDDFLRSTMHGGMETQLNTYPVSHHGKGEELSAPPAIITCRHYWRTPARIHMFLEDSCSMVSSAFWGVTALGSERELPLDLAALSFEQEFSFYHDLCSNVEFILAATSIFFSNLQVIWCFKITWQGARLSLLLMDCEKQICSTFCSGQPSEMWTFGMLSPSSCF